MVPLTFAYGLNASEFVAKYGDRFSHGEKVTVLVKVKGEPESTDPAKRAKEIRYFQRGILEFIHLAGATNVVSDTMKNQFTAIMTTTLTEHIATRYDIISVTILDTNEKLNKERCSIIAAGANLSGCDLYGVILKKDLRGTNFTNANLLGADLQHADLSGADMRWSNLRYALLNEANLTNANLAYSKMIRAELTNADLTNANFYRATLYHSDFTNSDLTNVDFRYSILTYAILANANLKDANFENSGMWATNLNHCYNHKICE
jgi:uncharacterized protein YjbI with pentapeptide repeats